MITRHISGVYQQTFDEHGNLVRQVFISDESNDNHYFWYNEDDQLVDPEEHFEEVPDIDPNVAKGLDTNLIAVLDSAQDHGSDLKPLLHGLFETFGNPGITGYLAKMGKRPIGSDPVVQECRETGPKACKLGRTPHIDGVCAVCEIREFYEAGYLRVKDESSRIGR